MFTYLKERLDLRIAFAALALCAIGMASVYSATLDAQAGEIFARQLRFLGVGIFAALVVSLVPFRTLQMVALPVYVIAIVLLVGVLLLGRTVSGSTSWFNLGLFRVQPSEFAKIATILALAAYLSRSDVSLRSTRNLVIATGIVALPAALVLAQPDFGTVLIYVGIYLPVLYWAGATRFTIIAILAPGAVAIAALFGTTPFLVAVLVFGILLYLTMEHRIVAVVAFSLMVTVGISVQAIYDGLKPYQQKRIATFLDPGADPLGAGYNIMQSKVAIGSGGMFGKGFLRGTQTQLNFIPEQWTDFIFCVPAEEFGFLGAATVLLLFLLLLHRTIALTTIVKSSFAGVIAVGIAGVFGTHLFINVGMALGLLPVVGVPLPFLSYGGSFLVATLTMTGLLLNIYFNRKEY